MSVASPAEPADTPSDGLEKELFGLAAEGLRGSIDPAFAAECLQPTAESFLAFMLFLGCDRMYMSDVYEQFYASIVADYPRNLYLLPRGTYKSTALEGSVVRDAILDRNLRDLYASETQTQAKQYVGFIRNQMEDNARLIEAVGPFRPKRGEKKWSDEELWVVGRTDLSKKEASITAKGMSQVRAGPHYGRIIIDDPCSPENTKTQGGLEATIEYFKLIFAIAETRVDVNTREVLGRTRLDVSCSRYDDGDVLGYIKKINEELLKKREDGDESAIPWRQIEVPAEDRKGHFFFKHLPEPVLRQLETEMGTRRYSAQYLLNPIASDKARFHRKQFRIIPKEQVPKAHQTFTYLLIDAATSKDRGDDTAIVPVSRDCTGRDFIRDLIVGQWSPNEVIEKLFGAYVFWNCRLATMEVGALKNCYEPMIEAESIKRQIRLRLVGITGRSRESKEYRIDSLDVPLSGGMLLFSSNCPHEMIALNPADKLCYGEAVEQFLRHPYGAKNDIPDALSDLYAKDSQGNLFCPRPKVGDVAQAMRPTTVNGRIDPSQIKQAAGGDFWGRLGKQVGRGGFGRGMPYAR